MFERDFVQLIISLARCESVMLQDFLAEAITFGQVPYQVAGGMHTSYL
jgi:hypothetical protein